MGSEIEYPDTVAGWLQFRKIQRKRKLDGLIPSG